MKFISKSVKKAASDIKKYLKAKQINKIQPLLKKYENEATRIDCISEYIQIQILLKRMELKSNIIY